MSRYMERWAEVRGILAYVRGYFWLPCPLCGRHFAGYEWKDWGGMPSTIAKPGRGVGICPVCTLEGRGDNFVLTEDGEKIILIPDGMQ